MSEYFSREELIDMGFTEVGEDVKVSKLCSLYSISGSIGTGSRIDDFTILKGSFKIGKKVHICSHSSLSAVGGVIEIGDLSGIGVNNIFYTTSDDMLQTALCGPLVNQKNVKHKSGPIKIGKGSALGGRVTIMPGTEIGDFSAFGVSSVLTGTYKEASVYMNINGRLKRVGSRDLSKMIELAASELSQ
ncbi:MAG: acyltransferase [Gammaproteobacteria bacterium]